MARKVLVEDEDVRAARLLDAQAKAAELFAAIEPRGIIAAGVREVEASNAIRDLAADMFGVDRHWHKRIVRAGPNTLQPYRQNPPDRVITADDIVFCDFGPVFEQWEADFGRTYVLGDDPVKRRLADALPVMFHAGRRFFEAHEDVTGRSAGSSRNCSTWARGRLPPGDRLAGGPAERRRQRGHRRVRRHPGGQRVRVGPVHVSEGDAVERDLRVVLGGPKLAGRLVKRRAAVLGLWLDHPRLPPGM